MIIFQRIKVFLIFWACLLFYFLIPFFIKPTKVPSWLSFPDQFIPFLWWMIIPYYSYFVLLAIFPFFFRRIEELILARNVLIKATLLCFIFYFLFPISSEPILMSANEENPLSFMHSAVTYPFLQQNAFPSLHVAISSLMAFILYYERFHWKSLVGFFALLIFFATFFIKQHYLWDSLTGLLVAFVFYLHYKNLRKNSSENSKFHQKITEKN